MTLMLWEPDMAAEPTPEPEVVARPSNAMKATTEEIVAAYRETGSVWEAGKRLGMAGQSIHERLVSIGYPMRGRKWSDRELGEMRSLASNGIPLGEIARRLGRPYGSCAQKASELQIRFGVRRARKIPRGAGFDKVSIAKHMRALEVYDGSVTQYARAQSLHVDPFVKACQRHFPERWKDYVATHSALPERTCEYCQQTFVPNSGRQRYCDRRCADDARRDTQYFGGQRRYTVGLAEGICQVCSRRVDRGLSSHHVLGKENDPDNRWLVALCQGCHHVVTALSGRLFLEKPEAWEALVSLAWLRKNGAALEVGHALRVYVSIDVGPEDEV